ncbi:MAG: hypothetical protein J6B54_04450 [Clostridia bacterium]|nr:hypothetical protein [Clostridia bacterium]
MKVLILTCHTGDGHNSAACAMAREMESRGWEYEIADPIGIRSKRAEKVVCSCYNGLIRHTPKAFGLVYHVGRAVSNIPLKSPVYYANGVYASRIERYIEKGGFDAILCTHLFGMEAVTALRRRKGFSAPAYGIMTDYTCIPFFRETELDGYFIPHPDLVAPMAAKGLAGERLYPTGIPVDPRFRQEISQQEARKQLNLPVDKKIVVIMTGGVGCESMASLCRTLSTRSATDFETYVLVGRNEKLAQTLRETCPSIHVVPFTRDVFLYMKSADVLLSKAGGLSSTEAAVAGVPLIHLKTIPGCESCNAAFFSRRGLSLATSSDRKAADGVEFLLIHPDRQEAMRAAQRREINRNAAAQIADRMEKR